MPPGLWLQRSTQKTDRTLSPSQPPSFSASIQPVKRALIGVLALLATGLAGAAVETPPFELTLAVAPVDVALDDAQVDVTFEPGAQPVVRVHVAPGAAGMPPGFEVRQAGGRARIVRTVDDAAGEVATVILEISLDPAQSLRVIGSRLSVAVRNPPRPIEPARPPAPAAGGDDDDAEPPPEVASQRYELVNSELYTTGAATTTLVGENTVIHAEDSSGDLTVELTLGSLSLRRHEGSLRLASVDAESMVEDLDGVVDFKLDGGSLELRSGTGAVQGSSTRGFVACDRWTGSVSLTGEDATFELRDGAVEPLRLTTKSTDVRIDGLRGSVFVQLAGGEVVAESVVGTFDITATAGAGVEVAGHDGPLTVAMRDDSSAELAQVNGLVKASLDRSTMTITGADRLNLDANDSRVTVAGISHLSGCVAHASELVLDLSEIEERHLELAVSDGSSTDVILRSPCQVQLRGSASAGQQVDVTGCEFRLQTAGGWHGGMRRDAEGRPPFVLTAKVAETGLLRVRGGP